MKNKPNSSENEELLLKIIWFSMLLSCTFFAIVPYFIIEDQAGTTEGAESIINNILLSAAFASVLMSFLIPNFLSSKIKSAHKLERPSFNVLLPVFIIKYAFIESVSLTGLALSIVNQNKQLVIPFVACSVVLYFYAYPSKEKLDKYFKN